jgi:hypothetical protein
MGEVIKVWESDRVGMFIKSLPDDIINHIIPYTYHLQSKSLLDDIQNYKMAKKILFEYYYFLWIDFYGENEPEDKHWLFNDLIAYTNDYHATMNGYVNKFYNILSRNIFLKTREEINIYFEKIERKNVLTQINILLGLLTPKERDEIIFNFDETRKSVLLFLSDDNF